MGVHCTVRFSIFCTFENFHNKKVEKRLHGASLFTQWQGSGRGTSGPRHEPVVVPLPVLPSHMWVPGQALCHFCKVRWPVTCVMSWRGALCVEETLFVVTLKNFLLNLFK